MRNCPSAEGAKSRPGIRCNNCGGIGHTEENCVSKGGGKAQVPIKEKATKVAAVRANRVAISVERALAYERKSRLECSNQPEKSRQTHEHRRYLHDMASTR